MAGRTAEAKKLLQQVVAETPKNVLAILKLGGLLAKERNFERALPLLRKAVEMQPRNRNAVGMIAQALEDLKRHQEALDFYLSGYDRWADDPRFGNGAVRMMETLGHTEQATRLRRKLKS